MNPNSIAHDVLGESNRKQPDRRSARAKFGTVEQLGAIADAARQAGHTIVLAHGVFDLLHMGHVRHFDLARREGSMLMVTVTADAFVNKGPGRPIFTEMMRAEMIAALECVDWVAINHASSAEPALRTIRPDIYVKGSDYENPEDDVTGKISAERSTVEQHGGKLIFTRDVTFSSSSLINRYMNVYDPPLRDHLERLRGNGDLERMIELIEKVKNYRILLVGDTIVDEYKYVRPMGKAAKENIIACKSEGSEVFCGGIVAAANHLASFCAEVEIVTSLGADASYEDLIRKTIAPNVKLTLIMRANAPTTRKCRFVDPSYMRKLLEVYYFDDQRLSPELEVQLANIVAERAPKADVVIVTDFGHGMISSGIIDLLCQVSPFLAVNAQTNAGNQGFNLITKYRRADYICLDAPEARLAVADKDSDIIDIVQNKLAERIDCDKIIVTHGQHGCIVYDRYNGPAIRVPAFTNTVVDTVGAGDAFLSVTAPLVRAGGSLDHVGFIGNAAGAIKVGIVGHRRSVDKVAMQKFITAVLK